MKSIETENYIDRIFYRPIGFRIARMLRNTGVTPNMITVISIFVGAATGFFFYHADLVHTVIGILFLIFANILDCVDGQLARLTGIKSKIRTRPARIGFSPLLCSPLCRIYSRRI